MARATLVGDWIQARGTVDETLPDGHIHIHAVKGGIGHVMEVDGDWFTVTWERTGTTTDTHVSEFKRLCDHMLGRFPITDHGSADDEGSAAAISDDEKDDDATAPELRPSPCRHA